VSFLKRTWLFSRKVSLQTVGGPATIQALESALEPLAVARNRYEAYREFLRMDPEANNAVNRLALLVQFAYQGPFVHAEKQFSENERRLQQLAVEACDEFDFRGRFFYIARHLLRDGDEAFVVHFDDGIRQIQPLPISKLTILESIDQIQNVGVTIQKANFYVLNEGVADKQQIFPQNESQVVCHISLDNYAEEVRDLKNRLTFGIWSESPLECLRSRILWKQAILITDILWRYRNVPREVHELDVSMYTPEKFAGATFEARLDSCNTAIQTYLKNYATQVARKKVDQGYVITKGTRIYYTEPTRVAYTSPNEVVEQINESIREGLGWHKAGRATYATELVAASYVVLLPDLLAYKIKRALLELLRQHLRKKFNIPEDELKKLDMRLSLVLDILRGELVRQIAILAAAGTHTLDELRELLGDEPITDEQVKRLVQIASRGRQGQSVQTILDILATAERQVEPSEHLTPESRRERQVT